jgi:hypothetical protein
MIIKQGPLRIHENFSTGVMRHPENPDQVSIVFRDRDMDGTTLEDYERRDVFPLSEEGVDELLNLLQDIKGSRIAMPTLEDINNLRGR